MKRHDSFSPGATVAVAEPPQPKPSIPIVNPALATALPPANAPKKGGLKKLSFGKIAEKKPDTKTAYPVFNDPAASVIAARIRQRQADIEALEGAMKTDKAELKQTVGLFYFATNHGKHEVPSSISIPSEAGEVLVCFQNRYTKVDSDDGIVGVLGDRAEKYFRQQDQLTINCDLLPVDSAQLLVDELQQLLAKYNANDAVEVKSTIKPVAEFHTARHTVLTIEENMALEEVVPIVAMIKTKGRGE